MDQEYVPVDSLEQARVVLAGWNVPADKIVGLIQGTEVYGCWSAFLNYRDFGTGRPVTVVGIELSPDGYLVGRITTDGET